MVAVVAVAHEDSAGVEMDNRKMTACDIAGELFRSGRGLVIDMTIELEGEYAETADPVLSAAELEGEVVSVVGSALEMSPAEGHC